MLAAAAVPVKITRLDVDAAEHLLGPIRFHPVHQDARSHVVAAVGKGEVRDCADEPAPRRQRVEGAVGVIVIKHREHFPTVIVDGNPHRDVAGGGAGGLLVVQDDLQRRAARHTGGGNAVRVEHGQLGQTDRAIAGPCHPRHVDGRRPRFHVLEVGSYGRLAVAVEGHLSPA